MKPANLGKKLSDTDYDPQDLLLPLVTRNMTIPLMDDIDALIGFNHSLVEGVPHLAPFDHLIQWNY